jgi:hypothetical protein
MGNTIGFFYVNKDIVIRLGVLYTLYCLHETQHNVPKVKIVVSLGTFFISTQILAVIWEEVVKFMEEVRKNQIADAYHIFRKMKSSNYFVYSALPPTIEGITNISKSNQG